MAAARMLTTSIVIVFVYVIPCLSQGFKGGQKGAGGPGTKGSLQNKIDEKIPRPTEQDKKKLESRSVEDDVELFELENEETLSNYKLLGNSRERSFNDLKIEENSEGYQKPEHFDERSENLDDPWHISLDEYLKWTAEKEMAKKEEERSNTENSLDIKEEDDEAAVSLDDRSILSSLQRESRGKKKYKPKKPKKPKSGGGSSSGGKEESWWPNNYGADLDVLVNDHPKMKLRKGKATLTDSCKSVRSVPSSLRSSSNFEPPVQSHYQKYTEAYGIPILGSRSVTDHGMMRTCYLLKVMFADRYDIRNLYYKLFGRFALIADNENQTDLPEYTNWKPDWNQRARGLGPTFHTPTTSAGDDNQRCKSGERYFDQDIASHELGHAIETLGSYLAIPEFKQRLNSLYQSAVVRSGKYKARYAATNSQEYFAVAVQFYFNAFRGTSYHTFGVRDRSSLKRYDSPIVSLLDDVFPCQSRNINSMIHRCSWKDCSLKSHWTKKYDISSKAKSGCPIVRESDKATPELCAKFACYFQGNVFNWKPGKCQVLKCSSTNNLIPLQGKVIPYNVYIATSVPRPDMKQEFSQKVKQMCTKGPEGHRCSLSSSEKKVCSNTRSTTECRGMGCCMIGSTCYYPKQDCADKSLLCTDLAGKKECQRNPIFMFLHCPIACNFCKDLHRVNLDKLKAESCQDKKVHCKTWADSGECKRNPNYMGSTCPVACGRCKTKSPFQLG